MQTINLCHNPILMYPTTSKILSFDNNAQQVLSAIITMCNEKSNYELLEEVSPLCLQIFVTHHSETLQKETGYYLSVMVLHVTENTTEVTIDVADKTILEKDAAAYFDANKIIKEFAFILKHSLLQSSKA